MKAWATSEKPRIDVLKAWNTARRASFSQPRSPLQIVGNGPEIPASPPITPPPRPIIASAILPPPCTRRRTRPASVNEQYATRSAPTASLKAPTETKGRARAERHAERPPMMNGGSA